MKPLTNIASSQAPPTGHGTVRFGAQGGVFSQYTRWVAPDPIPSRGEFYWHEFKDNYFKSRQRSDQRYIETLKRDSQAKWKVLLLSLAAGLGFTAFRRLRRTFSMLFMLATLSYPIKEAIRVFPKLGEAYEQVQRGNPSKGRRTFRSALDDSVYSIFQGFFKPFTYGMVISLVLSAPAALRREGTQMQNFIGLILRLLRLKSTSWPVRQIDRVSGPLIEWGDRVSNGVRNRSRLLTALERGL